MVPTADAADSFSEFFDAVDQFFGSVAAIRWGALAIAMLAFIGYLTLRSRASFNILRAAYPQERIEFLKVWGAYFAGYGFNSVIPARGGDVVRLFLTKSAVPNASYPAVAASFAVEMIFDLMMGILILTFAFTPSTSNTFLTDTPTWKASSRNQKAVNRSSQPANWTASTWRTNRSRS